MSKAQAKEQSETQFDFHPKINPISQLIDQHKMMAIHEKSNIEIKESINISVEETAEVANSCNIG